MSNNLGGTIRGLGELTLKGLVRVNAPPIFKGMLLELLKRNAITVDVLVPLITDNKSLWTMLPPDNYQKLRRMVEQVGDLNWLTTAWLIESVKTDQPAIASLFLSWRKGRNWLDRQLEEIKREVVQA